MRFPLKITDNFLLEPVLHTFGVRAETSFVEIHGDNFELKMGIWFHEQVPLSDVARIAPSEWPWWGGLGVKLYHHGIAVVGSTENVVNVQLKEPLKMRALFKVETHQLWLSVVDRDGFLRALSQAAGVPISEHTKF
jgi:hypothetical protein